MQNSFCRCKNASAAHEFSFFFLVCLCVCVSARLLLPLLLLLLLDLFLCFCLALKSRFNSIRSALHKIQNVCIKSRTNYLPAPSTSSHHHHQINHHRPADSYIFRRHCSISLNFVLSPVLLFVVWIYPSVCLIFNFFFFGFMNIFFCHIYFDVGGIDWGPTTSLPCVCCMSIRIVHAHAWAWGPPSYFFFLIKLLWSTRLFGLSTASSYFRLNPKSTNVGRRCCSQSQPSRPITVAHRLPVISTRLECINLFNNVCLLSVLRYFLSNSCFFFLSLNSIL